MSVPLAILQIVGGEVVGLNKLTIAVVAGTSANVPNGGIARDALRREALGTTELRG